MKKGSELLMFLLFVYCQILSGQQINKPKLIIGIVIDQMRSEYLYRFQDNYSENGFKRIMKEGFNVKNIHYNYLPTSTGPGHASIYTGTTPSNHGIVSNHWYNRKLGVQEYCAEDNSVYLLDDYGNKNVIDEFSRSPKNLLTSTITDELKLFTNLRSKIIGISIKDRGAIFPSGHLADYAFWYHPENGNFISSSYYTQKLPKWLIAFNKRNISDSLLNLTWKPLLPINHYTNSEADNAPFEKKYEGKNDTRFPYDLKKIRKQNGNYALLSEVPFGNTLLTQMALQTINEEKLGLGDETDFLTISFSSTDYIGHNFGIRSKEIEDTYIRLDQELSILLSHLDKKIGKNKYLLFLTADHAASDHPNYLKKTKLKGEFYSLNAIKDTLNTHLSKKFGVADYVLYMDNTQVYFKKKLLNRDGIIKESLSFLKTISGIKEVFTPEIPEFNIGNSTIGDLVKNSYHQKKSGDLLIHFYPGWMQERMYGTTHGSAYNSDTHIPLLWYGWKIPKGESIKPYRITQIASTLSLLLNVPLPNAAEHQPIEELFVQPKND